MKVGDKVIVTVDIFMGGNPKAIPMGTRGIIREESESKISRPGKKNEIDYYVELFYDEYKLSNYEFIWVNQSEVKLDISYSRDMKLDKLGI